MLIDDHFRALVRQPDMGRSRPELAPEVRSFPVGQYVIFYVPLAKAVDIVRVLHGARDIESILQEDD
jgi:toxin ParE1/3/4